MKNKIKSKRGKTIDVKVAEAAERIGVSERTVLNYLQAKKLKGLKVGKEWFVDKVHLDAFIKQYGFEDRGDIQELDDSTSKVVLNYAENLQSEKGSSLLGERKVPAAQSLNTADNPKSFYSEAKPYKNTVKSLRLFQLCKEVFLQKPWVQYAASGSLYEKRVSLLVHKIFEDIGAGYYAYGLRNKINHYTRARANLGGVLASLFAYENSLQEISSEINSNSSLGSSQKIQLGQMEHIEARLLPAFASLIRKLENSNYKNNKNYDQNYNQNKKLKPAETST